MCTEPRGLAGCRQQFPALQDGADIYCDGAAGTQVPRRVTDRMAQHLNTLGSTNVGGDYSTSQQVLSLLQVEDLQPYLGAGDGDPGQGGGGCPPGGRQSGRGRLWPQLLQPDVPPGPGPGGRRLPPARGQHPPVQVTSCRPTYLFTRLESPISSLHSPSVAYVERV